MILSGSLVNILPGERELGHRLSVGRETIRKALALLERDAWIAPPRIKVARRILKTTEEETVKNIFFHPVQEKKEPKRNVEVETLARDSVVSEKDMQAIQEKVSAVMEKYQPEIDKAVEEAVKAANIDEIVSAEMAKHQAEIDKAVQAAIEAAKINETIAAEMEKIQPEINRAIEEAMKAIDINEKAAKEASKEKSSFSGIVYIDGMESSKERMDNLNPDRIASMNVYKGNEAIAKFGEKGRNGVIEIKLKK